MTKGVFGWKKGSKLLKLPTKNPRKRLRGWDAYPTVKPITPVQNDARKTGYYARMQEGYKKLKYADKIAPFVPIVYHGVRKFMDYKAHRMPQRAQPVHVNQNYLGYGVSNFQSMVRRKRR